MTALLLASQAGHASVVESLLKNGAYVQHKNQVRQNGANRGLSGVGRSIRMYGCEFIPETAILALHRTYIKNTQFCGMSISFDRKELNYRLTLPIHTSLPSASWIITWDQEIVQCQDGHLAELCSYYKFCLILTED